ncbi:MAG: hypothetical protein LBH96_01635 [Candidatus Peribacteria bacterium]|nr:hypothetical protein [Candidatus Peribacteria bacterium]
MLLQYHQHAIYIEAEKSGYKQNSEEVFYHMQKKKSIEEKLYGPSILEIPYRAKNVAQKLKDLYTKGERLLSDEERSFWKEVMNPILQEYIIEEAVVDEGFRVH